MEIVYGKKTLKNIKNITELDRDIITEIIDYIEVQ